MRDLTLLARPRRALFHRSNAFAASGARWWRGQQFFNPGEPALLFFGGLRLPEPSDAVKALEHEAAVLSSGSEFRQSLDRTFFVQMQDEELLTTDFPEPREVGKYSGGTMRPSPRKSAGPIAMQIFLSAWC
jgi:hypothetical protein